MNDGKAEPGATLFGREECVEDWKLLGESGPSVFDVNEYVA